MVRFIFLSVVVLPLFHQGRRFGSLRVTYQIIRSVSCPVLLVEAFRKSLVF